MLRALPHLLAILLATTIVSRTQAQGPGDQPPPRPPGEHHGGSGNRPSHKGMMPMDADELEPEERERVRKIMSRVWEKSEVSEAREQWEQSGRRFQKILRDSMLAEDPELEPILAKIEKSMRRAREGMSPEGAFYGSLRGMMEKVPPEQRERFFKAHKKVVDSDSFKTAMEGVRKSSEGENKFKALKELRDIYRSSLVAEWPEAEKWVPLMPTPPPGPPQPPGDRPGPPDNRGRGKPDEGPF